MAERALAKLSEDSRTGPDHLRTRLLKRCSKELAKPVRMLTERILERGVWPASWTVHWIVPLYKKKSVFAAGNYRGIHLTSQPSKVVERL